MGKRIYIYEPCAMCEGKGILVKEVQGELVQTPCHQCNGTGLGRLKEIRKFVEDKNYDGD